MGRILPGKGSPGAFAANAADVRVRFHYDDMNEWAWHWLMDSVRVKGF